MIFRQKDIILKHKVEKFVYIYNRKIRCNIVRLKYENADTKYYSSWNEGVVHAADLIHKYTLDSFVMEAMIQWLGKCYDAGILTEEETGLPLSKIGSPEFIETLVRKISLREGFGDVLAQGTL